MKLRIVGNNLIEVRLLLKVLKSKAILQIGKITEGFKYIKAAYGIDPENEVIVYNQNRLKKYIEKT